MKKLITKKQIMSAIKITVLSAVLIVGLNYANAAWSGPTATAPDGNTPAPINIGTTSQIKNGGLGVNALSVFGNGLFTGKATAQRFCFANGVCISSWPEACTIAQSSTPTVSLTANPISVAYNGQTTLTWTSTNTTSCSANWTSSTATNGTATKSNLTTSTTYTITCAGTNGSAQASATVSVGSAPPPPPAPTVTLSASPTSVAYNGQTTLTWSSTNTTKCSANWTSSTATAESETLYNLTSSQTYTLMCTGAGSSQSASATITVGPCTQYTYYKDNDGDYYGSGPAIGTVCAYDIPTGYTTNNTDCNDNNKAVWRSVTYYPDRDGDGYYSDKGENLCVGNNSSSLINGNPPQYQASPGYDCYDANAKAHRGYWPYSSTFAPYFTVDRGDGSFDYDCGGTEKGNVGQTYSVASQSGYPYVKEVDNFGANICRQYGSYKMCTRGTLFVPKCGTTISSCGSIQYGASTMYADASCTNTVGSAGQYPGTYLDGVITGLVGCN